MPKNKVQLQKGLSLPEFLMSYGTEEDCRNRLSQMRWPQGFTCPKCGCNHYHTVTTRNLNQCSNCKHQCSLISGTVFEASKLPLTTWFLAIYFITQSKDGLSALRLENLVELDDVYWGGKKKRKARAGRNRQNSFSCRNLSQ